MDTATAGAGLKQRHPPASVPTPATATATATAANGRPKLPSRASSNHPGGKVKHGALMQFLRMCAFAAYFNGSIIAYMHHICRQAGRNRWQRDG